MTKKKSFNFSAFPLKLLKANSYQLKATKSFAMVIAVGIVALLSVVILGFTIRSQSQIQALGMYSNNIKAYYAAQAGLNEGLLAIKTADQIGFEKSESDIAISSTSSKYSYDIIGQASQLTDLAYTNENYIVPSPGTGTAGESCQLRYLSGYKADGDNECNWNKLYVGQTVNIPLYNLTHPNPAVDNGSDPKLTSLTVKIRTACYNKDKTGDQVNANNKCLDTKPNDAKQDRYQLLYTTKDLIADDNTIVQWQITDEKNNLLLANDSSPDGKNREEAWSPINSEIDESDINNLIYLNEKELGKDPFHTDNYAIALTPQIKNFLKGDSNEDNISEFSIFKPILQLSVIHSLENNQNGDYPDVDSVPYLEYQIVTDAQIASAYYDVRATGKAGNFQQSISLKQSQQAGSIITFAIQD